MNDTPWMTPFLAKHKRSPTARQDGIAVWIQNEIDYLEGIERTEHGNGALSAYRATLKEITPTETTPLAPNQRWTPAPGKRAKAREIMRLENDRQGYPGIRYAPFYPNCGWTQPSTIRVEAFRAWIRKMNATCELISDAAI